jgi:hypothetical protein
MLPMGDCLIEWDGRDDRGRALAAGVYFCRLETVTGTSLRTPVLAR